MLVNYHGHNQLEVTLGDLLYLLPVYGFEFIGIILNVVEMPFPRQGITYIEVLTQKGLQKINTNLIFQMRCLRQI